MRIEAAGELRGNLFYHPIDSDDTRFDACLQYEADENPLVAESLMSGGPPKGLQWRSTNAEVHLRSRISCRRQARVLPSAESEAGD